MTNFRKILFFSLMFIGLTGAYADSNRTTKREQSYTNGFALATSTGQLFMGLGYFFGNNNNWGAYFAITPYRSSYDTYGVQTNDSYVTTIGAGFRNLLPLARKTLRNKLFLSHGPTWGQRFGKTSVYNSKIQSSWLVEWDVGLQYRFNDHFYVSLEGRAVSYNQTIYKETPTAVSGTTNKTYGWNIGSNGIVALIWKI